MPPESRPPSTPSLGHSKWLVGYIRKIDFNRHVRIELKVGETLSVEVDLL